MQRVYQHKIPHLQLEVFPRPPLDLVYQLPVGCPAWEIFAVEALTMVVGETQVTRWPLVPSPCRVVFHPGLKSLAMAILLAISITLPARFFSALHNSLLLNCLRDYNQPLVAHLNNVPAILLNNLVPVILILTLLLFPSYPERLGYPSSPPP